MEEACIFCKIVKGEIPSYSIYEDEKYVGFMDIFPRTKGHALLIPKKHYKWVYEVPEFGEYWETAKRVANVIQKTLNARFISFVTVGEEVPHAHIHILPQIEKGISGITFTPVIQMSKDEISSIAELIKKNIAEK